MMEKTIYRVYMDGVEIDHDAECEDDYVNACYARWGEYPEDEHHTFTIEEICVAETGEEKIIRTFELELDEE